ncbi:MAG: hypothetical protein KBF76_15140 [Verrucomicrobiales bacterium]|nr:hypothetical protein [Verrucomicrobiales bacterium]
MWTCKMCGASVEDDSWESCWKCSTAKNASDAEISKTRERIEKAMECLRCESPMEYSGTKQFHEGSRIGVLGDLAELFVGRESYDVYFCTECGKVEFYIDGIGDAKRGENTA